MSKHPRPNHWDSNNYQAYKSLCAQTKIRSFPNPAGAAPPHATWKYKHLLRKMKSDDSDDTDTASIGDIGKSSTGMPSPDSGILSPGTPDIPRSPAHTRSYGEAKKTKDIESFYKGYKGDGVVYLPGDINGHRNCIY